MLHLLTIAVVSLEDIKKKNGEFHAISVIIFFRNAIIFYVSISKCVKKYL